MGDQIPSGQLESQQDTQEEAGQQHSQPGVSHCWPNRSVLPTAGKGDETQTHTQIQVAIN